MSQKWRRSQAWDDQFFPPWAAPAKFALRSLSSIWLAVTLLSGVMAFGILASVPIGVLALAPTLAVYGLTLLGAIAALGVLPAYLITRLVPKGRLRFIIGFLGGLALCALSTWLWNRYAWPALHYDPANKTGLRFFADFCERTKAITLRRLPGVEMSELEFYSWWPLRVILLVFVVNMVTATVRRIEFIFNNVGVLTVHTGIVLIAIGSVFYSAGKLEGDMLLRSGAIDHATNHPGVGPPESGFYDNTRVALHISTGEVFEQRLITGLPRYNDYSPRIGGGPNTSGPSSPSAMDLSNAETRWEDPQSNARTLEINLEQPDTRRIDRDLRAALGKVGVDAATIERVITEGFSPRDIDGVSGDLGAKLVGLDGPMLRELVRRSTSRRVAFRVVGYASYATLTKDYARLDAAARHSDEPLAPVRFLRPIMVGEASPSPNAPALILLPGTPASRIDQSPEVAVEYTLGAQGGMPESRWRDLAEPLPHGTQHALVIEIPGAAGAPAYRGVHPVATHSRIEASGYVVEVDDLLPAPPFPIITKGYENATSSLAKVRVTPPDGKAFTRWVYHRFDEISQDMLDELNASGMPKRRDALPDIRIAYIDASVGVNMYIDEPAPGQLRALVRSRGGELRSITPTKTAAGIPVIPDLAPQLGLALTESWEHSRAFERPSIVPPDERDNRKVGTHDEAAIAVQVSTIEGSKETPEQIVWLPFAKYLEQRQTASRFVSLADGRRFELTFGRLYHRLPGMTLRLRDFEMISYDHRGTPRDYQSQIIVSPTDGSFEAFEHEATLNYPLTAPYIWSESRSLLGNITGRIVAGLSPAQFKFSQAGWDANTWRQTQALVDQGQLAEPYVAYTILQVGNNPGIHIVALGAILMALGIPWAFYVKPWLVRREKARIQRQLVQGTYVRPPPRSTPTAPQSVPQESNA